MWLDELNELAGRLKQRIEQYKDVLGKNETATRYALIDPLLTALGWDLQDPGQVQTEYSTDDGRADYAMLAGADPSRPRLVIEAKKLGRPIGDGINQSITYCVGRGIPYFVVTNGREWAAYETHKPVPVTDKRIVDFSLTDPAQATVMKMLWLWRGNFESGSPMVPAVPDRPVSQLTATSVPQPATAAPPSNATPSVPGIPLHEFNPSSGARPPAALLFPDRTEKNVDDWRGIQVSVVKWLIDTGRLTEADCPVKGPRGGYFVATSPVQRNGKNFISPHQIDSVWIDTSKSASGNGSAGSTSASPAKTCRSRWPVRDLRPSYRSQPARPRHASAWPERGRKDDRSADDQCPSAQRHCIFQPDSIHPVSPDLQG